MDNNGYNGGPQNPDPGVYLQQNQQVTVPSPQMEQPSQTPYPYQQPPAPSEKPRSNKTRTLLIIVIILLIAAIAGVLCWFTGVFTKNVTVFFDTNGGDPIDKMVIKAGQEIVLPDAHQNNYNFEGWTLDGKPVSNPFSTNEDVLLKANWSPVYITVTFYSGEGLPTVDLQLRPGDKLTYPDPKDLPEISGYKVIGWSDIDGKEVPEGTVISKDMILIPILSQNIFCVGFDPDGGSPVPAIFLVEGEPFHEPAPPTRSGYVFICWTDKNGNPVHDGALLATEDIILKATWKKVYTITFDSAGGSSVSPVTFFEGEPVTLPAGPTKSGSEFVCWADKWGTPIYSGALLSAGDVTLYAKWHQTSFTISFDSKGGTSVSPITLNEGETLSLPSAPTRSGYRFGHWEDQNGMPILDGAKLVCEDVTLYAVWDKLYTITFDSDGGTSVAPIQFVEGDTFKSPPDPTGGGTWFICWVDPDGHPVHDGDVLPAQDLLLTAIWN